ncbi:uncharacterized protein F5891DRAFT_976215 [Suillus fuscotomentosus]|uniref:Uncharacterized protein n=1 Tax=Suillus fuscotomentosus TaxID=1912939 RepID=A0AAD4HQV8_9AGAM|nr:uncharacterized protein F5891DRAFT_976215 [Suillus fuscotomentosus]KAG1905246.1 hypothetical protein F5891DRAFT_976215 [Suillus fuscotomentosus]
MSAQSILVDGIDQVIICDNVIVMDIENLLTGWPTYEINFTPENPGPLKLIICLKDPVKMVHIEDSSDSKADLLISGNHKRKKFMTDTIKLTEDLAGLKITSQSSGNNTVKSVHKNHVIVELIIVLDTNIDFEISHRRVEVSQHVLKTSRRHRSLSTSSSSSSDSNDSMKNQSCSTSPPTTSPMHEEPKQKKSLQKHTRESSDSDNDTKKPKKRTKKHKDSDRATNPNRKECHCKSNAYMLHVGYPEG